MNQRGVIDIAIVAAVAAITLVLAVLTPLGGLFGVNRGQGRTTTQKQITTVEPALDANGKPVYVRDAQGNVTPLMRSISSNIDESTTPRISLWQRIKGLGFGVILVYVLALIFFPGAVHMFNQRVISGAKIAYKDLKTEAQRIVLSVDDGLKSFDSTIKSSQTLADNATDPAIKAHFQAVVTALTAARQDFLNAMSKRQDASTKTLVTSLKDTTV